MLRATVFAGIFVLAMLFLTTTQAHGQVLVYRMESTKTKGINYFTFESGYVVAPLLGGESSFLLSSIDGGRAYIESAAGGRLFTAVNEGDRRAVISATTGEGSAQGALVAMGEINHSVRVSGAAFNLTAKVAKTLTGTSVTADDESELTVDEVNQESIGVAGISAVKFTLDERETERANKNGNSVEQAVEVLKLELERQGYVNLNEGDDDDDEDEEEQIEVSELNFRGTEITTDDVLAPVGGMRR
ncbi:hypothetical protein FEM03_02160 [Phragmitibacter flavus]|uniref:Uncharacterized protein n=1 Tax=Phragmitibacter flavus TaxID=2576071 RepID=A0A5R8KIS5_9BACT|nr:hypothetical protein [Phragmitibacter flavus]TLD72182.1 hypothetical protein FEM03_02160 [Phragmitibacter flavus]